MMLEIAKLLVGPALTLLGVILTYNKKMAIIETKLEELTREVREHNNFAKRMPVVENDIKHIKRHINL